MWQIWKTVIPPQGFVIPNFHTPHLQGRKQKEEDQGEHRSFSLFFIIWKVADITSELDNTKWPFLKQEVIVSLSSLL